MGTLSWILTLLAGNGVLMAALLLGTGGNRSANRFLAVLVGLISLRLAVYILGFAGMYDDHPWITFAPLDFSLAFGPLLWLYLVSLTRGGPPARWRLHLVPATIQFGYSLAAFTLPLDAKLQWFRRPHLNLVEPAGLAALLASGTGYLALAWLRQRHYQRWLDDRFADRERWRLGWLTAILFAFAAMVAATASAAFIHVALVPLDYFGRTPVIIATSLIAYSLGLLGWRHAGLDLPVQPTIEEQPDTSEPRRSPPAAAFPDWSRRIEIGGWWREEGITLAETASRLGVSERTLSRGLNEGAGVTFNAFVNGLRVAAVKRAIAAGTTDDLLSIAFACGFSSKASFNRAFLRETGTTPSAWRAAASQMPPISAAGAI